MNPYASYLGDRDPIEVMRETPAALRALAHSLGTDGLKRSTAPGKWTASEILCHLADTELAFAFRLRQALAEPNHVIQSFDQEKWAVPYSSYDAPAALEVFSAVRNWNITLLKATPARMFSNPVSHPERGEMTFQTLVDTIGGHDLNHLRQLETIESLRPA